MSGFIPEQIVDTVRFTQYSGGQRISHYCGYAADFISQVLEDDEIDGAAFPHSCDSCRVLPDYLSEGRKFVYPLYIPARQDSYAADFFAKSIYSFKSAVERYYGITIRDVSERIALVNKRNRKISALYEHIAECSYADYLRSIHFMLKQPLAEQTPPQSVSNRKSDGIGVFLVGSFLANVDLAAAIENAGLRVVGDNITNSKRLFSAPPVNTSGDIFRNIAESLLNNRLSPTQDNFSEILRSDLDEMKRKNVKGVIFVTQKFCEPYDYLFLSYQQMLDENGIPALRLVQANSTDRKRSDFSLEAFRDIL
jgi:benzoyl-CoA reductase/2-hydroxyglutaryl-CoA dehydratase subunit BcrC/BadD/HgdB